MKPSQSEVQLPHDAATLVRPGLTKADVNRILSEFDVSLARNLEAIEAPGTTQILCPMPSTFVECLADRERVDFVKHRDLLPPHHRAFLTPYTVEQYDELGIRLFLTERRDAGFGLHGTEIVSIFSLPGARYGVEILRYAIALGGDTLDYFDVVRTGETQLNGARGVLSELYARFSFVEVARHPWEMRLAPTGWDYDRYGKPDWVLAQRRP